MRRLTAWLILVLSLGLEHPVSSEEENPGRIRDAIQILNRVPTGSGLIRRAEKFWGPQDQAGFQATFRWGYASKTDAVITRHYNTKTGEEQRERSVIIYLKARQPMEDLVLDLAHELTHATARPNWDPYDPGLTPVRYISAAIDGVGGEVDALVSECLVSREMALRFGTSSERCEGYFTEGGGSLLREKIQRDFYRIGRWAETFTAKIGSEVRAFPLLSPETPKLFSSTGHTPYPVALFQEYEAITRTACENSRRRQEASPVRIPASVGQKPDSESSLFLKKRCNAS